MAKPNYCQRSDRHAPGLVCGYPLPCPHHTVVLTVAQLFPPKLEKISDGEYTFGPFKIHKSEDMMFGKTYMWMASRDGEYVCSTPRLKRTVAALRGVLEDEEKK